MRKFALIPLVKVVACVACLMAGQSFAQPRDLFAEFEAEEAAAETARADSIKAAEEKALAEKKAAEEKALAEKKAAEEKAAAEKKKAEEEKQAAARKAAEEKALAEEAKRQEEAAKLQAKKDAERDAYEKATMKPEDYEKLQAQRAEQVRLDSIGQVEAQNAAEAKRRAMEQARLQAAMDSAARADAAAAAAENKNVDVNEEYARAMQAYADSARVREDLDAIARDSAAVAQMIADSIAAAQADSIQAAQAAANSSSSVSVIPSSSSMNRRDLLGPVKVSKVNGIDEMKGRYRSPRKALFMSLVVPGSGQLYVGGSSFTKARGGIYLALEAALWGSWYYFSVYKYDQQVDKYKDYAKEHYSIGRYERKMRDLYDQDARNYESEFRTRYLGSRESFCEGIYGQGKAGTHGCFDKSKLYYNDKGFLNDFVSNPVSLGDEMEEINFYNDKDVYQLLSDKSYVLGWDDLDNEALATSLELENPESSTIPLGTSSNMDEYRSMRNKANDYADMQAWFFGGLILNHIISAVDAALTANAYNKTLYQEDLSWYDHLHFDSGVQFFGGFGVNVQASWGF